MPRVFDCKRRRQVSLNNQSLDPHLEVGGLFSATAVQCANSAISVLFPDPNPYVYCRPRRAVIVLILRSTWLLYLHVNGNIDLLDVMVVWCAFASQASTS